MSVHRVIGGFVAASLIFASTGANCAPSPVRQVNPWAVLTAMSGGPAAAVMCGSASSSAAMQSAGGERPNRCVLPVIDAPAATPIGHRRWDSLLLGLMAIVSAAGAYLAFNAGNHPNSPA